MPYKDAVLPYKCKCNNCDITCGLDGEGFMVYFHKETERELYLCYKCYNELFSKSSKSLTKSFKKKNTHREQQLITAIQGWGAKTHRGCFYK